MHGTSCPKSLLWSTCLTAKFGSLLDYTETWSVLLSNIWFLWFLQSMFHLFLLSCHDMPLQPIMHILLTKRKCRNLWPQFVYIAVSLGAYIEKLTWVLGTNVAITSWLHWSPVSWYKFERDSHSQNQKGISSYPIETSARICQISAGNSHPQAAFGLNYHCT